MTRRKAGPIPKALKDLKTCRTTVWSTQDQLTEIDVKRGHYSRSEWFLLCGLEHAAAPPATVIPEANLVALAELKQGPMSNLSQLVKHINALEKAQPGAGIRDLAERMGEVLELANQLRDGLAGAHIRY